MLKIVKLDDQTLPSIADAIREKGGSTEPMLPSSMAQKIRDIPSGGGVTGIKLTEIVAEQYYDHTDDLYNNLISGIKDPNSVYIYVYSKDNIKNIATAAEYALLSVQFVRQSEYITQGNGFRIKNKAPDSVLNIGYATRVYTGDTIYMLEVLDNET